MKQNEVTLEEMNILLRVPESAVALEVKATILDEDGETVNVSKKLSVKDIFKSRKDFLDNVEDGDDYDALYVLTDKGQAYAETLMGD